MEQAEVKFKFWLGHTKKMTYEHTLKNVIEVFRNYDDSYTDDIIPLQFIGYLDDNGKEIYNGDILKVQTTHGFHSELLREFEELKKLDTINGLGLHFIGVVEIDLQRGLMFKNPQNGYREPMFSRHMQIKKYHSGIEVIGNIYENPELLTN